MSPEEKKLDKLKQLFEIVNEDYATPDDLIKVTESILSIITSEKKSLEAKIADNKGISDKDIQTSLITLSKTEQRLRDLVATLQKETSDSLNTVTTQLSKEIKRVEKKIPTKTDLSEIEREIRDIKDSFNSFPTELTINNEAIRDGLELLEGDERLDKSAIKGLDDYDELIKLARTPKEVIGAGVRLLRYLADVNIEGITNGQTIVWSTALQRFEAGSAGSGGGHTIQDEGVSQTQRTNLNFIGLGVTVTDNAGADSTDVTITSGGGSGDVVGPASAVDNNFASFNLTTGKLIKDSGVSASSFASALGADDNYVTDAEKAALHAAVTATDSTSIDFILTGQDITAQREALTGAITAPKNSNATSLGSFTKAQLDTAVTDGNILYVGDITQYTDELAQDAVGAMVATSIVYNDAGATLQRAALTGAITASQDSNTTALGSFTKAQLDTAVSDGNVLYVGDVVGVTDGDKGDVTVSATGATWTVDNSAITLAKMADIATDSILGRATAATGVVEVLTALPFAYTGDVTRPADSNVTTLATVNSNVGAFTNANITVNAKGLITAASNGTGGGNTFNTIYIDQSGGTSDTYGVLSGTINGSNAIFTVSQSAYATGTLKVWLNGQLMTQGSAEDWTETTPASGTFTFVTAPATGSLITVSYQRQTTNGGTLQYARQIVNTSVSATVGSTANTDYVYFITGAHTMSLPAASGNTNLYTFKNNHSANVTIDTVGAETIDGTASISIAPEEAVDIISNGTNYYIT